MIDQPDHVQGLRVLKDAVGSEDLAKQIYSDANASDRQTRRDHFDARMEFVKQQAQIGLAAETALKEYGLQTLKWLFLLNAGAIGLVLAYIAGKFPDVKNAPAILKATWPFAAGCISVVGAGGISFLNFSYGAGSVPNAEALHKFLDPSNMKWPSARMPEAQFGAFLVRHRQRRVGLDQFEARGEFARAETGLMEALSLGLGG
jgi:hypothetical protein